MNTATPDYTNQAVAHVLEHARYSNAVVPPSEPYTVRYPLSSGRMIRGACTHELVEKVVKAMKSKNG